VEHKEMIELNFTTAFMLYLGITLLSILGIWIFSHYRTKKQIIFSTEHALFVCEYCHFAYLEENIKELNKCPQCNLFNKQNQYTKLNKK
jgi:ribosomal protein L37AE/L43A